MTLFFSLPVHAQLGGGNLGGTPSGGINNIDIDANPFNNIELIPPPLPENTERVTMPGDEPDAEGAECSRYIYRGYFWDDQGPSAADFCDTEEVNNIGEEGNEIPYKVFYLRHPFYEDSGEEFTPILQPPAGMEAVNGCHTYSSTPEEIEALFESMRSMDTSFMNELKDVFLSTAYAEVYPGRMDEEIVEEWSQSEKIEAARMLELVRQNLRTAIDSGEYGEMLNACADEPHVQQRAIAELMNNYLQWIVDGLNNGQAHTPYGVKSLPPIYWSRMPEAPIVRGRITAGAYYTGTEIHVGVHGRGSIFAVESLLHELVHWANDISGFSPFDTANNQITRMVDEWLAGLSGDLFFWRHLPAESVLVTAGITMFAPFIILAEVAVGDEQNVIIDYLERRFYRRDASAMAETIYNKFMDNVQMTMLIHTLLSSRSLLIPFLPLDVRFSEVVREITRNNCETEPGTCFVLYDRLFPDCAGDNYHDGCPSRARAADWDMDEWTILIQQTEQRMASDWAFLMPYAQNLINEFYARGGFAAFGRPDSEDISATSACLAGDPSPLPPLQKTNWDFGAQHQPPWLPSGTPGDPGIGLGPPQGIDPTGHNGMPGTTLGSGENDPNWSAPPADPDIAPLPESVRKWPDPDSSNATCHGSTSAFNWCWHHIEPDHIDNWQQTNTSDNCLTMAQLDMANDCGCSTGSARTECSNTWDEILDAASTTCDESCDSWPTGTQWICRGGCAIGGLAEDIGEAFADAGEWLWERAEDVGEWVEDVFTCDRDAGEIGDTDYACECDDESYERDGGHCRRDDERNESGSSGPGLRNCMGTNDQRELACGTCYFSEIHGQYRMTTSQCHNESWSGDSGAIGECYCPCLNPAHSGSCLQCRYGNCGNDPQPGGGGSGVGGGQGDGSGSGAGNDDDEGGPVPAGEPEGDLGSPTGDPDDWEDTCTWGTPATVCAVVDEAGNEWCASPCECCNDNPWNCRPISSTSTIATCDNFFPDAEDTLPQPDSPPADEDNEVCQWQDAEWWEATASGYPSLECARVRYCCDEVQCEVRAILEDDAYCSTDTWYPDFGTLWDFPPNWSDYNNCYPYVGDVLCYNGSAGAACFPSGVNLACNLYCGCVAGTSIGYISWTGYCLNPLPGGGACVMPSNPTGCAYAESYWSDDMTCNFGQNCLMPCVP